MDRQNKVLKELLDRLTSFVTEDKVAELAMLEAQKEVDHKERVLPIKRKSPSFEAQDSSEEVNLGTNDNPIKTKVSGLLVGNDKNQVIELITRYIDFLHVTIMRC